MAKYEIVQHFTYYPLGNIKDKVVEKEFNSLEEVIEFAEALRENYGYNYVVNAETGERVYG